jgi:hypothetical protein
MEASYSLTERYRQLLSYLRLIRERQSFLVPAALTTAPLAALVLWTQLLVGADASLISDLGLITAMPPVAFVALFVLIVTFVVTISQARLNVPLIVLHIVVLIYCLFGAAILVEGQPRTATAWKLVGIIDQVMHHGSVDATKDAFQNWPGFFILVAFLSRLAGIESPLILASWAHVFFNLLYLGPLLLLFRAGTQDKRLIWLAIWLFYLCNWIGQDYLAPQALGYFYYVLILGVLLTWFQSGKTVRGHLAQQLRYLPARLQNSIAKWLAPENKPARPAAVGLQQTGLLALLFVFMAVMVPSHQLTPVALLAAVAILVVAGRITPGSIPLILGVMIVAYISFMTVPYLRGHVSNFTKPLGDLTANVTDNVTARVRGSPLHTFVVMFRIFSGMVMWLIAGLGIVSRIRAGQRDTTFLLLAAVPFGLLGVQTYGGELLLRTFLFALPFTAFFMAAVFYRNSDTLLSARKRLALMGVCAALSVSFFVTRYGNERMDYFTADEVAAVEYVYAVSGPGTHLVSGTESLPWRYEDYNSDRYSSIERAVRTNNLQMVIESMSLPQFPQSFLVLTRSQQAAAELYLGWEPGAWERFDRNVSQSDQFRLVYANEDAKVFVLAEK